jgi:hypothetical protein
VEVVVLRHAARGDGDGGVQLEVVDVTAIEVQSILNLLVREVSVTV